MGLSKLNGYTYQLLYISVCTGTVGKHFRHLTKAVTSVHPGATIDNLERKIHNLNLKHYKVALLLVGTNDLTPEATWQWYKDK